ncbi:MAG: Hemolysin-type calcium-binding region [Verrucomicrobiales bacterium]|nr:Hemolysin-type calcium-binding region [Verrucomicrobiales bacterium]
MALQGIDLTNRLETMNHYHPGTKGTQGQSVLPCSTARSLRWTSLFLGLLAGLCGAMTGQAGITEPATVFYGKVINRTSGQEYALTNGHLVWILRRSDGSSVSLSTELTVLRGGDFSYRLDVPHQALSSGLDVASNNVPLTIQASTWSHLQISVDGFPASIVAPGSAIFAVAQSARASTYRLDLELLNSLPDSDVDGIPDWWANRFGVDDANGDSDHDGWTNLEEFRRGTNPSQDNRIPTLSTRELLVYADGTSGIMLHAVDSDSGPANLFYVLTAAPEAGILYLRAGNAGSTSNDLALAAGATFTQQDVNMGRLVFTHTGGSSTAPSTSFSVTLRDENPAHPTTNAVVTLSIYRPSYPEGTMQLAAAVAAAPASAATLAGLSPAEQQLAVNYCLSRNEGYIIWDSSRSAASEQIAVAGSGLTGAQYAQIVASGTHDRKHVLAGGFGADRLSGGMEGDIFIGGRGNDILRGNGGSDLFIISSPDDGNDTIEDFNPGEGDAIDISRVLQGVPAYLTNYVLITNVGTNSYLNISFQGSSGIFTDMVVTLLGQHLTQSDLRMLVENGNLLTGNKVFAPRISIASTIPAASQNGPVPGLFTLTRLGGSDGALTVNLYVAGSARVGQDYELNSPQAAFVAGQNWQVTFLPGQNTARLSVNPYGAVMGGTRIAQVSVLSGAAYDLGSLAAASVSIEDLLPQITIEALNPPIAIKNDQTPGYFLINRGGVINQSVLVRLVISGTATRGSDYDGVPTFVNFNAGDTSSLITVMPKATAVLSNGMEYVQVSIQTNAAYKVLTPSVARVSIIDQMLNFALWQQRNFPGSSQNWSAFALEDSGNTGIPNLYRYAFGLNPQTPSTSFGIPAYRILDGHLSVSFRRPMAISDLDYVVEVSDDLIQWRSSGEAVEAFLPSNNPNDLETVWFRSRNPVSQMPWQFMRVRVVTP